MNATFHDPEVLTAGERVSEAGKRLVPYLLVIPGLLLVLGVLGYAVAGGFVLSLNETDMFLNKTFVGLKNYIAIFHNPRFQNSLWRTLAFVVLSIALGITLSMMFALTLYHVGFGRRFLPWAQPRSVLRFRHCRGRHVPVHLHHERWIRELCSGRARSPVAVLARQSGPCLHRFHPRQRVVHGAVCHPDPARRPPDRRQGTSTRPPSSMALRACTPSAGSRCPSSSR